MLVKFLNPFEDEQNLFMGASKQVQCKNVQCNKFNSLQYSIIIPYTYNIFTHTKVVTIIQQQGFKVHTFADDLQIYGHNAQNDAADLMARICIIKCIATWMHSNPSYPTQTLSIQNQVDLAQAANCHTVFDHRCCTLWFGP